MRKLVIDLLVQYTTIGSHQELSNLSDQELLNLWAQKANEYDIKA